MKLKELFRDCGFECNGCRFNGVGYHYADYFDADPEAEVTREEGLRMLRSIVAPTKLSGTVYAQVVVERAIEHPEMSVFQIIDSF